MATPATLYACTAFDTDGQCVSWQAVTPSQLGQLTVEQAHEVGLAFLLVLAGVTALKVILKPRKDVTE